MASELETQLADLDKLKARGLINDEDYATRRSAILTAAAAPGEPSGRRRRRKFLGCGCIPLLVVLGLLVIVMFLFLVLFASGGNDFSWVDTEDATVTVGGDPGIKFSGSIGTPGRSQPIDGTTPQVFTISGQLSFGLFEAMIAKQQEGGRLTVTLTCSGGEAKSLEKPPLPSAPSRSSAMAPEARLITKSGDCCRTRPENCLLI